MNHEYRLHQNTENFLIRFVAQDNWNHECLLHIESIDRQTNIMQQVGSIFFCLHFTFHSIELDYCLQINIFLFASCDYKSVAYLIFYFIARTFGSLSFTHFLPLSLSPLLSPLDSRSLVAYNKQLCGFANCMIHFVYMYLCTVKELATYWYL